MPEASLLLAVAAGGAGGALVRFAVYLGADKLFTSGMLVGTLTVNVVGSFLLGLAVAYFSTRPVPETTRVFVTFGLLGAFTTFSTFSFEAVSLIQDAQYTRAALYVVGSVVLGLLALVAGTSLVGVANSTPVSG